MDCGIVVDLGMAEARCIPMARVEIGMPIVVGHAGVRVLPTERSREVSPFGFMNSAVSSEKPKSISVKGVVDAIRTTRAEGKKVLLVGGPAIVHTGSAGHVARLIREGWIQVLFAGNALATHDIEQAMYGTSLGVSLDARRADRARSRAPSPRDQHDPPARGNRRAVDEGVLTSGIMYECVKAGVDVVLAGSIRDDGPLPEVITDTLVAQDRMRQAIHDVGFALLIATALHSIATGNLLPAWVKVVCVDINPATVTKLSDRGTFQTIGLVTDVEPFLRSLASELAGARRDVVVTISSGRSDFRNGGGLIITMETVPAPRILMCPPDYFAIEYEINPWMNVRVGSDAELARRQWTALYQSPRGLGVSVDLIEPVRGPSRPGLHGQRRPGLSRSLHRARGSDTACGREKRLILKAGRRAAGSRSSSCPPDTTSKGPATPSFAARR